MDKASTRTSNRTRGFHISASFYGKRSAVVTGTDTIGTVHTGTIAPGAAHDTSGAGAMHSTTGTGTTFTASMVAGTAGAKVIAVVEGAGDTRCRGHQRLLGGFYPSILLSCRRQHLHDKRGDDIRVVTAGARATQSTMGARAHTARAARCPRPRVLEHCGKWRDVLDKVLK